MTNETIEMRTRFGITNKIRLMMNVISSLPIIPTNKGTHRSSTHQEGSPQQPSLSRALPRKTRRALAPPRVLRVGDGVQRDDGEAAVFLADGVDHVEAAVVLMGVGVGPLRRLGPPRQSQGGAGAVADAPHAVEGALAGRGDRQHEGVAVGPDIADQERLTGREVTGVGLAGS